MPSLSRAIGIIEQAEREGLHIGAQLYVSLDRQIIADQAFGQSRPGAAMRTDTLMPWLSSGKPLTAVALGQLWEQGKLDVDDPVARFIPEFAAAGKDRITLRHVLTHTSGIAPIHTGWPDAAWDRIIADISAAPPLPGWVPGKKAGYSAVTGWFILGEIVQRISGLEFDLYLQRNIFSRLNMVDCHAAIAPEQYDAHGDRIGIMQNTAVHPARAVSTATARRAAAASPGASLRGPIRELAKLYEALLFKDSRLLQSPTICALSARHRTGLHDHSFRTIVDWGLGFIINSWQYGNENLPYSYGPYASARTFGHSGAQSSCAFADPERMLVIAAVFNGMCGEVIHARRQRDLCAAIYEDLQLA